jgi:folate-binding protein YgfZ
MPYSFLPHRQLLRLTGDDTIPFLQGLISNDISHLDEGRMLYSALLSPQGKFLHDFFIVRWKGIYWLDCDASRMPDLQARLMLYRLRSKVTIEPAGDDMVVAVAWDAEIPAVTNPDYVVAVDPRLASMGVRAVGTREALEHYLGAETALPAAAYDAWRISHAVPDGIRDMIADKSLLLEFGYEQLHGVDFNKGCYVGQEVTARSKFRAQLKKALYLVRAESGDLPEAGTQILGGEVVAGELRSSAGGIGLALLRPAELETISQSGFPLRAGHVVITAEIPSWWAQENAA